MPGRFRILPRLNTRSIAEGALSNGCLQWLVEEQVSESRAPIRTAGSVSLLGFRVAVRRNDADVGFEGAQLLATCDSFRSQRLFDRVEVS